MKKAKCYKNACKENGIKHLFKDTIDSKNKYIVLYEENTAKKIEDIKTQYGYVEDYYNNHYAESGKTIKFVCADRVGNYSLYNVISEKADKS